MQILDSSHLYQCFCKLCSVLSGKADEVLKLHRNYVSVHLQKARSQTQTILFASIDVFVAAFVNERHMPND